MAQNRLEDVSELHLRSALSYALQAVKLPRRRTKPPFDMDAEKAERDVAVDAIIAQLKLNKWRVMSAPLGEHLNPDPHATPNPLSARLRTLKQLRGHVALLRVACPECGRRGVYILEKQIEKHGADCSLLDWMLSLTETCSVRLATPEKCAAGMVDMEQVLKRLR